jgi:hypothetical protein
MYPHGHVSMCAWPSINKQNLVMHYGAREQNLVMHYGPETVFSYFLFVKMQNLVMCYSQEHRIYLCTMGHNTEPLTAAQSHMNLILKNLPHRLKEQRNKNSTFINCTNQGYTLYA